MQHRYLSSEESDPNEDTEDRSRAADYAEGKCTVVSRLPVSIKAEEFWASMGYQLFSWKMDL